MSVRLLTNWFIATRPWSFTMTLISVSVGSALAALDGSFSWGLCLLAAAGAVFMHAGTNLLNDYYDVKHGLDTLFSATAQYRPHAIVHGLLPVSYTHLRAHETPEHLVCRLLLEKKNRSLNKYS